MLASHFQLGHYVQFLLLLRMLRMFMVAAVQQTLS